MEGLGGGRRCANALTLEDGVLLRDKAGVVDTLLLRARFLGGEIEEGTILERCSDPSFFCTCGRLKELVA